MPGQHTFPRALRLTHQSEYRRVFAQGEKFVGPCFICYVARTEEQGCRLGLAVSRKVGNAVVRNRVKRYLREFYRTHRPEFAQNAHLVVVARPGASRLGYRDSAEALGRLLQRGGIMHG